MPDPHPLSYQSKCAYNDCIPRRKRYLCPFLTNHILVKHLFDFLRLKERFHLAIMIMACFVAGRLKIIFQNGHAQIDALIADINTGRPCNQAAHFALGFSAEGAANAAFSDIIITRHSKNHQPISFKLSFWENSALVNNSVDQTVFQRFLCRHEIIALRVLHDSLKRLTRPLRQNFI